jgi:hypothetical protein
MLRIGYYELNNCTIPIMRVVPLEPLAEVERKKTTPRRQRMAVRGGLVELKDVRVAMFSRQSCGTYNLHLLEQCNG